MSNREPRDFSLEERRRQFLAFKKAHPPNATEVSEAKTQWHLVADPMTVEQVDQIPPGQPGIESRVGPFWVKYFHRERHQVVVARGLFDHEHWTWTVRFTPEADHRGLRQSATILRVILAGSPTIALAGQDQTGRSCPASWRRAIRSSGPICTECSCWPRKGP
jgi:hypothetical protein